MQKLKDQNHSAIELQNVTFAYSDKVIFDQLNLQFLKGQIHGILGPNGAGKSTLIKIISGLLQPSVGQIFLNGQSTEENFSSFGSHIGLLSDRPPLYPTLSVMDYLLFCAEIKKCENPKAIVKTLMQKLNLDAVANSIIQTLSTGFRQRVALAQALVHNPPILILDEPTSGLDPQSAANLRHILLELSQDHTILFSSHLLHEVQNLCTHITMVDKGKILFHGFLQEFFQLSEGLNYDQKNVKIRFSLDEKMKLEQICTKLNISQKGLLQVADNHFEVELTLKNKEEINTYLKIFLENNCYIDEISSKRHDLEESFLHMMTRKDPIDKNV
jgi:ABC-2 type transport system ATP-binding protein